MFILMTTSCYCSGRGLHFENEMRRFLSVYVFGKLRVGCLCIFSVHFGDSTMPKVKKPKSKWPSKEMIGCGVPAVASFTVTVTPWIATWRECTQSFSKKTSELRAWLCAWGVICKMMSSFYGECENSQCEFCLHSRGAELWCSSDSDSDSRAILSHDGHNWGNFAILAAIIFKNICYHK